MNTMNGIDDTLWEELLADAEAIATEYQDEGWEVLAVETGGVSPATKDERFGLSVLLPGSDYEALEELIERDDSRFDGAEVYRNALGDTVYLVTVELDTTTETAVIVPMAYSISELQRVFEQAFETGTLEIHLRPLTIEQWVTFSHDDPSLFVDEDRVQTLVENDPRRKLQLEDTEEAANNTDETE